jgi:glycosyltransferase involved in cell wall biosynthesis
MRKNRADCVHNMKTCKVYKENGWDVIMVTPHYLRKEYYKKKEDIWDLYGFEKDIFRIIELPTLLWDSMGINKLTNAFSQLQKFTVFLLFYLLQALKCNLNKQNIIYGKSYISVIPFILLKKIRIASSKLFYEKGEFFEKSRIHKFICQNTDGLLTINKFITDNTIKYYEINRENVHKIDFPSQYEDMVQYLDLNTAKARTELNIETTSKIVMYAGKIAPQMLELKYILECAKFLPGINFYFVGMKDESRAEITGYLESNGIRNAFFRGFQPLNTFMKYLKAADILVSYYDSKDSLSPNQRTPAKSTVYFCSGKPLIFPDMPGFREWWNDDLVYFVKPDSPELLADKIKYIFNNPAEASIKAHNCLEFAKLNTYEKSYGAASSFMINLIS